MNVFTWGIIGVALFAIWVFSVTDLFRRHLPRGQTAAWAIIMLVVPVIGAAMYWILRGSGEGTHGGAHPSGT